MQGHSHPHRHEQTDAHQHYDHDHTHGALDPALLTTEKGIWAVKWSLLGLLFTAVLQSAIVAFTSSVALLADTIHNFGDAATALPLWIAFLMARREPSKRFNHGYRPVGEGAGIVICKIVWDSGKSLFSRLLDGVDPEVIDEVRHAAHHVAEVLEVTEVRVRWLGHRLLADVNIAIKSDLSVEQGHQIAREVRHQLLHHLPYLANATIHVDPVSASGEHHHRIVDHEHDELPSHSH